MAGQGIDRREILHYISIAAVAAAFPGFRQWTFACAHESHVAAVPNSNPTLPYQPLFLSPEDFRLVDHLTEMIIPADDTPGAKTAGVSEFIDFMLANRVPIAASGDSRTVEDTLRLGTAAQVQFVGGLNWLNTRSKSEYKQKFLDIPRPSRPRCSKKSLISPNLLPLPNLVGNSSNCSATTPSSATTRPRSDSKASAIPACAVWPDDARLLALQRSRTRASRGTKPASAKTCGRAHVADMKGEVLIMPAKIYDVDRGRTGAGGGTAIKVLCEAGLEVCAVNSGPRTQPDEGLSTAPPGVRPEISRLRRSTGAGKGKPHQERYSVEETEYSEGRHMWEHDVTYSNAPGTDWYWKRARPPAAKRISGDDRRAASATSISRPPTSTASAKTGRWTTRKSRRGSRRPSDTWAWPAPFRIGPAIPTANICRPCRSAASTTSFRKAPRKSACRTCPTAARSSRWRTTAIPRATTAAIAAAAATWARSSLPRGSRSRMPRPPKKLTLLTNALVRSVLVDENGMAKGVAYVDRETRKEVEVYAKVVVLAASCVETAHIMLNSKSRHWPTGIANSSGQLGRNLCDHLYGCSRLRLSAAAPRPARHAGQHRRLHGRLDASLAESHESRAKKNSSADIRSTWAGAAENSPATTAARRLWPRFQARHQALLSHAHRRADPGADAAEPDQLRRHRSGQEGHLRHSRSCASISSGVRTS